ncbi:phage tail protein [Alloalcanivorax xenomutans]|uniref:phage tail protein n=1 Tax=Alloalcanivorax xenomutans TaxID=1094342 RepID=UPI003BAA16AF
MNKLQALRDHLVAKIPHLKQNPDKLLTFVDTGEIHAAAGLVSHSNRYTANIIVTDWSGSLEDITVPVLDWLQRFETDHPPSSPRIRYEADVINHTCVDISLSIELTDAVKVADDGTVSVCADIVRETEFGGTNALDEWEKANG